MNAQLSPLRCLRCGQPLCNVEEKSTSHSAVELVFELRDALRTRLFELGQTVAALARISGIDRRRLDWFLNNKDMKLGPSSSFYTKLLEVERKLPGHLGAQVVGILHALVVLKA